MKSGIDTSPVDRDQVSRSNSAQGYHRAPMRHGVSEITGGKRHTLGVIFHDAA